MTLSQFTRILIVEDNPLIAAMLEATVEDMGYKVVGPYYHLQDALDHVAEDDIDFGLLDFDLGDDTDCLPIVELLAHRGVPFAITSGTDPAVIHESLPNCQILSKPVIERELEEVLPSH